MLVLKCWNSEKTNFFSLLFNKRPLQNHSMFDSDYVLPVADTEIDVRTLSTVFNNTTGTYKFYWFLSLLDLVCEHNLSRFSDREIVAQMVANAWYPVIYFRLSFGIQ